MLSERLAFVLTLDSAGAVKGLQRVGSEADKNLGKVDQRLDRIGSQMTKFGAGALAASGVAAAGLFELGSAADKQNASVSALTQVLGESSTAVLDWADDSVKSAGLSKRAAVDAATSFGSIGKAAGFAADEVSDFAIEQTELAADLAAFKNVSPEQALQDLQAGYAGSSEVLRKYNIYVDDATLKAAYFRETGEKVTGTLTAQQKIVATHSEIMRQSADMQGQWGREIGSAASQQAMFKAGLEDFAAGVGTGVLPVMTNILSVGNKVVGGFNDLDGGTQKLIGTIATFSTIGIGAVGTIAMIGGQVVKLTNTLRPMGDGGERAFSKTGKAAAVAGGVIAAAGIAAAIVDIAKASDDAEISAERWAKATSEDLGTAFQKLQDFDAGQAMIEFRALAEANVGTAQRLVTQLDAIGVNTDQYRVVLDEAVVAQKQANVDQAAAADIIDDAADSADNAADSQVQLADATKQAADAARGQADALRDALDATFGAGDRTRSTDSAIESFTGTLDDSADAGGRAAQSIDLVAEKQKKLDDATGDAERALDSFRGAAEQLEQAQRGVVEAQEALDEAMQPPSERSKAEKLNDEKQAALDLEKANVKLTDAQGRLARAEEDGDPAELADARLDLEEATLAQERATWRAEDATTAYNESMNWSAENDPKVAAARDVLTGAQERVSKAAEETAKKYGELLEAQQTQQGVQDASLASFGTTDGVLGTHRDRVREVRDSYFELRDAIFEQIEAALSSNIVQAKTMGELDALEAKIKAIPGLSDAQRGELLGAVYSGKASSIGFTNDFAGYASGTANLPLGDAIVGENGPERIRRTATGFEVADSGRTRSMLRAGGGRSGDVNVNLYGASVSPHDVAREVAWQTRTT